MGGGVCCLAASSGTSDISGGSGSSGDVSDGGAAGALVTIVGAGPGAPDLLTLRGAAALVACDAVVYDELGGEALLDAHVPRRAARHYAGKRGGRGQPGAPAQRSIEELLVALATEGGGRRVVRLKGGDPAVFGRLGSELGALRAAGIDVDIVPGVSTLTAGPLAAGFPLTAAAEGEAVPPPTFSVVTAHDAAKDDKWSTRGAVDSATLVLFMGARRLAQICAALISGGWAPETPLAVVQWATTPQQRVYLTSIGEAAVAPPGDGEPLSPAVIVVGDAVRLADEEAARRSAAAAAMAAARE